MFERPDDEARQALYKSVGGSWWEYVLSILAVGFGVSGIEYLDGRVQLSHPILARLFFGNPGIVFVCFGILSLVATIGLSIQKGWESFRRRRGEAEVQKRT
jgi:hypothetical protein